MTAYAQQAKFVQIIRSIGKLSDRMSVVTTDSGYRGFCLYMNPGEVGRLRDIMRDENINVQVIDDRMQLIQGISDSEIYSILY